MSDVDRDLVQRIANMAELSLSPDELGRMTDELGSIVSFVQQLQEVDIDGVPPTSHVLVGAMPLRPDAPRPSLEREAVLGQAPSARDDSFVVPAFVDEG